MIRYLFLFPQIGIVACFLDGLDKSFSLDLGSNFFTTQQIKCKYSLHSLL